MDSIPLKSNPPHFPWEKSLLQLLLKISLSLIKHIGITFLIFCQILKIPCKNAWQDSVRCYKLPPRSGCSLEVVEPHP